MKINKTIYVVATNRSHYDRIMKVLKDAGYSWVWTPSCDLSYSREYDVIEISPDMMMDRLHQSSDLTYTNIDFLLPEVKVVDVTIEVNKCKHTLSREDACRLVCRLQNEIVRKSSVNWLRNNPNRYDSFLFKEKQ